MNLEKYIDHTILKATATNDDIKKLCLEAIEYGFMSVCVNPCNIKYAKELLKDSDVLVCTVIGFPLGANTINVKVYETQDAIKEGADEIDMVINIAKAKMHDYAYIYNEIKSVVDSACGKTVKVILETCYLDDDEIVNVSKMALKANATFVKTSTGFGSGGAKLSDIKLMNVGLKIKASGGIKSKEDFLKFIDAGASRIGTSSGIKIIKGE